MVIIITLLPQWQQFDIEASRCYFWTIEKAKKSPTSTARDIFERSSYQAIKFETTFSFLFFSFLLSFVCISKFKLTSLKEEGGFETFFVYKFKFNPTKAEMVISFLSSIFHFSSKLIPLKEEKWIFTIFYL